MFDQPEPGPATRLSRRRRIRRWTWFLASLSVGLILAGMVFRRPLFEGNVGIVDPGLVFRSAQPQSGLDRFVLDHRLGSVLNLRGGSLADPWYANEVRVTGERGVDFYDFPMNAERQPTRRELLTLLDFFRNCRYPLLIHCKQGADRTGLASAIYLMAVKNVGPAEALASFSLTYGHIPIGRTASLHAPLNEYLAWLDSRNEPHSADRFRDWVDREYRPSDRSAPIRPLLPGPRKALVAVPERLSVGSAVQ